MADHEYDDHDDGSAAAAVGFPDRHVRVAIVVAKLVGIKSGELVMRHAQVSCYFCQQMI
jgi:hypothetical protein